MTNDNECDRSFFFFLVMWLAFCGNGRFRENGLRSGAGSRRERRARRPPSRDTAGLRPPSLRRLRTRLLFQSGHSAARLFQGLFQISRISLEPPEFFLTARRAPRSAAPRRTKAGPRSPCASNPAAAPAPAEAEPGRIGPRSRSRRRGAPSHASSRSRPRSPRSRSISSRHAVSSFR